MGKMAAGGEGLNRLIQQGAALITCSQDILDALTGRSEPTLPFGSGFSEPGGMPPEEPSDKIRQRILTALGPTPVEVDDLIRDLGEPPRTVHVILLELELAGRLERHRGQKVSLVY